ncbi:DUF6383 domain-containing protein [Parabacteroides sp.]
MNKKFSTLLMAGMLVAGSSFNALDAQVKINQKVISGPAKFISDDDENADESNSGKYLVIRDSNKNDKVDANDVILVAKKNNADEITYSTIKISSNDQEISVEDESTIFWNLEEADRSGINAEDPFWVYGLKNENTGVYLTVKDGDFVTTVVNSLGKIETKVVTDNDVEKKVSSAFVTNQRSPQRYVQNQGLLIYNGRENNSDGTRLALKGDDNKIELINSSSDNSNYGLLFVKLGEREIDYVNELNDIQGGEGFQFSFEKHEEVLKNIFFEKNLRAFKVPEFGDKGGIVWGAAPDEVDAKFLIPSGIYLASEWSGLSEVTLATNTISSYKEFQKATFVAALPQGFVEITHSEGERSQGHGFTLGEVSGADMNFYALSSDNDAYDKNQASSHDEVYVGNACFTITAKNPMEADDKYELKLANVRLATDKENKDDHANKTNIVIGTTKNINNDDDVATPNNYLVTKGKSPITVTAVPSSTQADVKGLLTVGAPSIYTVEFIGGAAKGQFLTSQASNYGTEFKAASMPALFVNENDPMYQFVIADIFNNVKDVDANKPVYETVTFTNRQTKMDVTFTLYKTAVENEFIIFPKDKDQEIAVAVNTLSGTSLWTWDTDWIKGMTIRLNKKENVDKFATFESRESYDGLVSFQFAKTAESEDRLYAAAKRDRQGDMVIEPWYGDRKHAHVVTSDEMAEQFELIRSKNYQYITNDFKWIDANGKVVTPANVQDTVAFYSYTIKLFTPGEEYCYLNSGRLSEKAGFFVIKENKDGSVALFETEVMAGDNFGKDWAFFKKDLEPNPKAGYYASFAKMFNKTSEYNVGIPAWVDGDVWFTNYYELKNVANQTVKTFMVDAPVYGTLAPVKQKTTFANGFNYLNMSEMNAGILKPEALTLELTPADVEKNIPSFYIANEGKFMYFAKDSAETYRLTNWEKYAFTNTNGERASRIIFKAAELNEDGETLQTIVDGQSKTVAMKAVATEGILGGLYNFQFSVVDSQDGDDTYVIQATNGYVVSVNGQFTLTSKRDAATRFEVETTHTVANENIEASSISVATANGAIIVKGAEGKNVVITNVLGQQVANTFVTSSEATIAAPAGVVFVAVEGEAAVKAIVK